MSQSLRQGTLTLAWLTSRLSRSLCVRSVISSQGVKTDRLSEILGILPKVQCRNLSLRRNDSYNLESRCHRCPLHNQRFSSSALSWSPKEEDELSRQTKESPVQSHLPTLPPAETIEELREKYKCLRKTKKNRFVLRPELARLVVNKVWPDGNLAKEKALIVETSPGPGILTRQLLNSGAPQIVSLEREKPYLPGLGALASKATGRLRVMHADFFAMHYHGTKDLHPPLVRIDKVFEGLKAVPWEADIPIKVIGSLPHRNERTQAYLIASQLLERLSSFKYGRVQFNVFMSEGCYKVISQPAGNMSKYRALSALMQMSCDIELLHSEPQVSFRLPTSSGEASRTNFSDKDLSLCLVRLTPKRDLFIKHQLSQHQAFVFVYFVRQVLAKRRQLMSKMIEAWAPGHGDIVHDFGYDKETLTGSVNPTDLLRIYMAICHLDSFNGSWMGEDMVGYASRVLDQEHGVEYDDSLASRGILL
ncbi:dimethyladenosine transferase 2, mitochondrial-like [Acanthaster planci]|uniref:rRNA adenine N(6)-methyltransferase n=1 Tax=Acanthaster planci TaxID=133434 RepID=A0A8B7ZBX8_ACAPL|nr:dimethyladenosine transferase 2, mitochondrial-like [Acanthaster planci]XP_022103191.1 dimethyladenosine transferase 2, mitochondrial-like [Acanthaster planci]